MASILKSIFTLHCPRCGKGELFLDRNPYHLKHMTDMPDQCPECGQDFRIETGFYWGAFYVSYMLGVAFCLPCFAILLFLLNVPFWWALVATIFIYITITPYTTRLSRSIWLAVFHNKDFWDK